MKQVFDLRKRLTEPQENLLVNVLLNDSVFHVYEDKVVLVSKQGNESNILRATFDSLLMKNILKRAGEGRNYLIYQINETVAYYYNAIFSIGDDPKTFLFKGYYCKPIQRVYRRESKLMKIEKNLSTHEFLPVTGWNYLDFSILAAEYGCYRIDIFEIKGREYLLTPWGLVVYNHEKEKE